MFLPQIFPWQMSFADFAHEPIIRNYLEDWVEVVKRI